MINDAATISPNKKKNKQIKTQNLQKIMLQVHFPLILKYVRER